MSRTLGTIRAIPLSEFDYTDNRKAVTSADGRDLFSSGNYLFSTKKEGKRETLYFKSAATKKTGRLRQEHREGPLATIDNEARTHLFVSERRYTYPKRWHERKRNRHRIPKVYPYECCLTEGTNHIEFACKGKRLSHWHHSRGIVEIRKNLKPLIDGALNKVCGK
jgi:hypothetical protein